MLLKGSIIDCFDNSGCGTLKIIQLYSKKICHSGEFLRGVLHKFDPSKNKLQRKKHYMVICFGVVQNIHRQIDYTLKFFQNKIIMVSEKLKRLLGTRIFGPIQRELRKLRIDFSVYHKIVLLSRYIL